MPACGPAGAPPPRDPGKRPRAYTEESLLFIARLCIVLNAVDAQAEVGATDDDEVAKDDRAEREAVRDWRAEAGRRPQS
jgi:hypothetical protein